MSLGASSCALAPAGSYVPMAGSNTSTPARQGTFQSNTGLPSRISASIGFYVPSAGATKPNRMRAGIYKHLHWIDGMQCRAGDRDQCERQWTGES